MPSYHSGEAPEDSLCPEEACRRSPPSPPSWRPPPRPSFFWWWRGGVPGFLRFFFSCGCGFSASQAPLPCHRRQGCGSRRGRLYRRGVQELQDHMDLFHVPAFNEGLVIRGSQDAPLHQQCCFGVEPRQHAAAGVSGVRVRSTCGEGLTGSSRAKLTSSPSVWRWRPRPRSMCQPTPTCR